MEGTKQGKGGQKETGEGRNQGRRKDWEKERLEEQNKGINEIMDDGDWEKGTSGRKEGKNGRKSKGWHDGLGEGKKNPRELATEEREENE